MLNDKNALSLKGQTIGTIRASSSYLFIKPHHHTSLQPPPTITLLHPPPSPPQGSTVPGDPNKTLVAAHPPPPMASPEKRCLYEVLNLPRDCTADEIRSAYSKLALQRHPDKLIKSGIPESEATASFQELVNAYKVLSDVRERAWYDSHRSQILFSGTTSSSSLAVIPDLFTFFSNFVYSGFFDKGKGFYKVYGDVFDKIYMNELNYAKRLGLGNVVKEAPVMGNLESGL
ncbi:putative DNAJ protein JJJ1 plant [Helianthus annuus]|nr:putative DNAJ protein JJJ1 plant [Helianthus annuus]